MRETRITMPFRTPSRRFVVALVASLAGSTALPLARQDAQRRPSFRAGVELIYVNVVVRDGSGNIVRNLKPEDFSIVEDDKAQTISAFDFEEVPAESIKVEAAPEPVPAILKPVAPAAAAKAEAAAAAAASEPIDLKNRRLIVLLFDASSMQPDELERAVASGYDYIDKQLTPADLVAVASVGSTLQIVQDFTADREMLTAALGRFSGVDTVGFEEGSTLSGEETDADGFVVDDSEFNIFNTDRRLAAIEQLSDALAPIQQKKSIVYFSSGVTQRGEDNKVQLRSAIDRAVKANVSIYPVDARGLTAVVPGGAASQSSGRGGTAMFSGRGVSRQFDSQSASQDTLVSLASDTGGKAFLETNDFGGVYTKVIADTSAYYLIGYSSTNPARDGRFRRIRVKVNKPGLKVEHRNGYYATRDFQHSGKEDREKQLQDQLMTDLSSTDLTVWMSTSYFRLADDRFYVPVSIAVPGSEIPFVRSSTQDKATIDVIGLMRDAQQRPVGRLRDTVKLAVQPAQEVKRKTVQYESGFTLPPGKYRLKVVLRENQSGAIGSYERDVVVPDLRRTPVKLSSVVLGTQTQPVTDRNAVSPLARNGTLLVPSLTHVV
ncbi:MAG TPA: VWA domain-containing protein, partial [Vicinamibacterales bacterium]|nr:VWA domain-containing protein [Vicinamibacterales bacterium]